MPWYTPHVGPSYFPTDPNFADAWHINRNAVRPGTNTLIDLDINVHEVWTDYTGFGVTVGIYDDYVDADHDDLFPHYNPELHARLANGDVLVPNSANTSNHGTQVAGIIAASAGNGEGSVGVAFNATIAAVPVFGPHSPDSDADMTAILEHMANFDVVNHSWGFYTAFEGQKLRFTETGPSALDVISDGVAYAAENGRGGLGTIVVSAAGNERVYRSETYDGQTYWFPPGDVNTNAPVGSQRQAIAVAAVAQDGFVAPYSSPGANLLVSAPSAGDIAGQDNGLPTTSFLYSDYRDFGGTSAAAPVVSGVVALILDANPNLGWRDVKEILAISARHVGSLDGQPANTAQGEVDAWDFNGATNWNGGGMHFSHDYGFGLVDAHAAVRLAETWGQTQTSANEVSVTKGVQEATPILIPNAGNSQPLTRTFVVTEKIDIETITLDLDFYHPFPSLLEVVLTSPSGTVSTLLRAGTGGDAFSVEDWSFSSNAFMGESSVGTWTLTVVDRNGGYGGSPGFRFAEFSGAKLNLFGSPDSNDDTYYFTNEFAYLPWFEHFFVGGDFNGGHDTINAAAVTWDTVIDLQNGTFTMGGRTGGFGFGGTKPASFYMIEDIITGDGEDTVTGNAAANLIRGMRGNDHLMGMDGADTLEGGLGVDTLEGGRNNDILIVDREFHQFAVNFLDGGENSDTLSFIRFFRTGVDADLASGAYGSTRWINMENMSGTIRADTLRGDDKANILDGFAGADILDGRGGRDTMNGGAGGDTYYVDNEGDVVNEEANAGTDKVFASVTHTLAANVEDLELTGTRNIDGNGNGLDNVIIGNAGNNTLNGRGGTDIMRGGLGNDIYVIDSADDRAIERSGEGIDTVRASIDFVLGSHIENLKLTGTDDIDGTGNALDNTITGNAGRNVINGGAGRDTLFGAEGNDIFVFASAAETGVGSRRDIIRDFEDFGDNDTIDLSGFAGVLTFSKASTFSGALNEVIAVQAGDDVLIRIDLVAGGGAEAEIRLKDTLLSQVAANDFLLA